MDKRSVIWTIVAVAVLGLLAAAAITRNDSGNSSGQDGLALEGSDESVRGVGELPQEVIQRIVSVSDAGPEPLSETVKVTLRTTMGDIALELYGEDAPLAVGNFVNLARRDFYDGVVFHRVIPGFMIQGGDPFSISEELRYAYGTGGPQYIFPDEINDRKLVYGSLAMANAGSDTNGSQFFIVVAEEVPHLDGRHTNFGQVTEGMDVVVAISRVERDQVDNPLERVEILDVVIETPGL